jgi:HEAT repeat protein
MQLNEIQENLQNLDYEYRIKAIKALHNQPTEIAIPILLNQLSDREFLVRTFIAMALAKHQTDRSFTALLELMKFDDTPSVRAEAANALSLFGPPALSHLVATFIQDDHWLLRRSILAAILDMNSPIELLEICLEGIKSNDRPVQEASIAALGTLENSPQQNTVMETLLELANHENQAKLQQLRQDPDHRVIAATLEDLL